MIAKHLQSPGLPFQGNNSYAVFDPVRRNPVTDHPKRPLGTSPVRRTLVFFDQPGQHRVSLIINKHAPRLDLPQKDAKLLQINIESWKNIDMIPGNAGKNRNMREKKMELWPFFKSTGRIFI